MTDYWLSNFINLHTGNGFSPY